MIRRTAICTILALSLITIWMRLVTPELFQQFSAGATAGNVPVGGIIVIATGTCASGYAEVWALNELMIRGTLAANGDVGTTAGNDTITPAGTISTPTFTGNAATLTGTVSQPTFTGSALATHTHTLTPAGTIAWPAGVPTASTYTATTANRGSGSNVAVTAPTSYTPTIAWPAGVPTFTGTSNQTTSAVSGGTPSGTVSQPSLTMNSYTPAGSVSQPTFTGTAFDNRPVFKRVIFCQKT